MSTLSLRQSGGANIISIPKKVLRMLDLHTGDKLDLQIKDNAIILTPVNEEPTLEQLIAQSPKSSFSALEEDRQWEADCLKGGEF
ncbi:MAG: AbrB/MazE/SpoVT family DNA-binding domain-containing protein [Francisellaceae bacterium]